MQDLLRKLACLCVRVARMLRSGRGAIRLLTHLYSIGVLSIDVLDKADIFKAFVRISFRVYLKRSLYIAYNVLDNEWDAKYIVN